MKFNVPKAKETPKDYSVLPWTEEFRHKFPVQKIKEMMKNDGISLDGLVNHLNFRCRVDRDKAKLAKSVIENEVFMVQNDQEVNLVVNLPFCLWRCFNCTFVMYDKSKNDDIYPYFFDALIKEIEKTKEIIDKRFFIVKHIAFTGNLLALEEEKIERVFKALNYTFCDISIELGSPEFVTENKLKILKKYNVSRIIINSLTFNTQTLRKLCRRFEFKDIYEAYKLIISYGFETSFELVVGLLDENILKLERNINLACELGASNIDLYSCHCPYIEEPNRKDVAEIRKIWDFANNYMQNKGYVPYYLYCSEVDGGCFENVGYTLPGRANKYFIDKAYQSSPVIGCGTNISSMKLKNKNKEFLKTTHNISQYVFGIDEIIEKKNKLFS